MTLLSHPSSLIRFLSSLIRPIRLFSCLIRRLSSVHYPLIRLLSFLIRRLSSVCSPLSVVSCLPLIRLLSFLIRRLPSVYDLPSSFVFHKYNTQCNLTIFAVTQVESEQSKANHERQAARGFFLTMCLHLGHWPARRAASGKHLLVASVRQGGRQR